MWEYVSRILLVIDTILPMKIIYNIVNREKYCCKLAFV